MPFNEVFPLFINIFVGWDALAKARRGKEKKLKQKENPDQQTSGAHVSERNFQANHWPHILDKFPKSG